MSSAKIFNEPKHTIDFLEHGNIIAVQFSPYEWSQDIILIAFKSKLIVGQVLFHDTVEYNKLAEIELNDICTALCLSPETTINALDAKLLFCTGSSEDFTIRVFMSNLEEETNYIELKGHRNYINDISYDMENNYIASTSDDKTAKLWSVQEGYKCVATFILQTPGKAVCWHRENLSKLMVAEQNDYIRFYNVNTRRPIMSIGGIFGKTLESAHWAPSDSQLIVSLNMGELYLYDITKPSSPKQRVIFTNYGGEVKVSPLGEYVAALNKMEGVLRVIHLQTLENQLATKVNIASNVSWHFRLPIICVGDDTKLNFWNVLSK